MTAAYHEWMRMEFVWTVFRINSSYDIIQCLQTPHTILIMQLETRMPTHNLILTSPSSKNKYHGSEIKGETDILIVVDRSFKVLIIVKELTTAMN